MLIQPFLPGNESAVPRNKPSVPGNESSVEGRGSSVGRNESAVPVNDLSVEVNEPFVPGNKPSVESSKPSVTVPQRAQPQSKLTWLQNPPFFRVSDRCMALAPKIIRLFSMKWPFLAGEVAKPQRNEQSQLILREI